MTRTGGNGVRQAFDRLDAWMIGSMATYGIGVLRVVLGVVFVWFGLLKVIGRTPVAELVSQTVYWIDPSWFVPVLGLWEVVVELGLAFAIALRVTLLLFWLQLAGTFLVLVLHPDVAFQQGNPFLLTTEGEFVIKNLVLIAAGLVVGGTVQRTRSRAPGAHAT